MRDMLQREACLVPMQPKEPSGCTTTGHGGVKVKDLEGPLLVLLVLRTEEAEFSCKFEEAGRKAWLPT